MRTIQSPKILWAVDPFAPDKAMQFATFKAIERLTEGSDASIEPVAVLSSDQLRVPTSVFTGLSKEYRLEAETILNEWSKELDDPRLMSPRLLIETRPSTNASIESLLAYAKQSGAQLVAMGTHTKKKMERFLVGSFAETMLLKCPIPMLVVNPRCEARKISHILFPTDFSEFSLKAFDRVLPIAQSLGAKITLYYKFDYLLPETMAAIHASPNYERFVRADEEARRRSAIQWAERAAKSGVKLEVMLDEKASFVADGVTRAAAELKADLIAMASSSGTLEVVLLGSVARQIVRMAEVPVWILHPRFE